MFIDKSFLGRASSVGAKCNWRQVLFDSFMSLLKELQGRFWHEFYKYDVPTELKNGTETKARQEL